MISFNKSDDVCIFRIWTTVHSYSKIRQVYQPFFLHIGSDIFRRVHDHHRLLRNVNEQQNSDLVNLFEFDLLITKTQATILSISIICTVYNYMLYGAYACSTAKFNSVNVSEY